MSRRPATDSMCGHWTTLNDTDAWITGVKRLTTEAGERWGQAGGPVDPHLKFSCRTFDDSTVPLTVIRGLRTVVTLPPHLIAGEFPARDPRRPSEPSSRVCCGNRENWTRAKGYDRVILKRFRSRWVTGAGKLHLPVGGRGALPRFAARPACAKLEAILTTTLVRRSLPRRGGEPLGEQRSHYAR